MTPTAWKPAAWIAAAALLFVLAMSGWAAAGGSHVRGAITWYKPSGHDAATTHGTRNLTFEDGAVLLLEHHGNRFRVKVTDTCDGSACRDLDISQQGFRALGIPVGAGVGKVRISCGRSGNKPMNRCTAGEER